MIFDIIKQRLNGRETEDDLIELSIETTKELMFKFLQWLIINSFYLNNKTDKWCSDMLGIENYTINELYYLFDSL